MPLFRRLETHVLAAARLHGDDTTVPVLARGKTDTGRLWVYVRDDRPFAGPEPPTAVSHYSRDRRGRPPQAHPRDWTGLLQDDPHGGYAHRYPSARRPGLRSGAGRWAPPRHTLLRLCTPATAPPRKPKGRPRQRA